MDVFRALGPVVALSCFLITGCEGERVQPEPPTASGATARLTGDNTNPELDRSPKSARKPVTLADVRRTAGRGHLDRAWAMVEDLLIASPGDPQVLLTAGEIQLIRDENESALQLLAAIDESDPEALAAASGHMVTAYLALGQVSAAIEPLNRLLAIGPQDVGALHMLTRIYHARGQRHLAQPYLEKLVAQGQFSPVDLMLLEDLERGAEEAELSAMLERIPAERHHYLTYIARHYIDGSKPQEAGEYLAEALTLKPDHVEAWVWSGYCRLRTEGIDGMQEWLASRPSGAEAHPIYWTNLGDWYELLGAYEKSCYAYLEALKQDPHSRLATVGIARSLIPAGLENAARQFNERQRLIDTAMTAIIDAVYGDPANTDYDRIIEANERLGRDLLVKSWAALRDQARAETQVQGNLVDKGVVIAKATPVEPLLAELSAREWPPLEPNDLLDRPQRTPVGALSSDSLEPFAVEDVTVRAGLAGVDYGWGMKTTEPDVPIFRSLGGGTAALDYDGNGWPDLYFSVAEGDPRPAESNKPKRLFRNFSGTFEEVSVPAGVEDIGYGQAVLSQDLDQDGADDLIVCNFGSLRLFYNAGDGTFHPPVELPLHADNAWLATAAIADLNGDRLPDILGVTYCGGDAVLSEACQHPDGTPAGCGPRGFPGGRDYLWINQGDGSWQDRQSALDAVDSRGRGLAAVVGNIDGQPGLEMYIANDSSANDLLRFGTADDDLAIESLTFSGTGLSAFGQPQGSMGLSLADFDHNGLEDLIVTNYRDEHNSVLLQSTPTLFQNVSYRWGMGGRDVPLVGFGVQAIDFDYDGWEDLLIVNGHIEDETDHGGSYHMPPLLYRNNGQEFLPIDPASAGEYLASPRLGRGMGRLDYDGDLGMDLIITHADEPAVLLANTTSSKNGRIQIELIGVDCERQAVGTIVDVQLGDKKWRSSLAMGEGYFSADQRLVEIGLGQRELVDEVTIRWPDGSQQTFRDVAANHRYRLVQHHELEPL